MTTPILFANNAGTTLALPVASGDATATLYSGSGALFPSPGAGQFFPLTFIVAANPAIVEIVYCTGRSGDVLTISRAQEGTTALGWNAGDVVNNQITAGVMEAIQQWTAGDVSSVVGGTVAGGVLTIRTIPTRVLFTTPGAWTWTVPATVTLVSVPDIRGAGGGGAGGTTGQAGGGGGGGGKCAIWNLTVAPGDVLSGAVGTMGVAGTSGNNNATAGGDTTLYKNSVLVATASGGNPGAWATGPGGGVGGAAVGGTSNWNGTDGGDGSPGSSIQGGNGAPGEDGQGGGRGGTSGGRPAAAPGAGGGGGYQTNCAGGNGYPGQVMIEY